MKSILKLVLLSVCMSFFTCEKSDISNELIPQNQERVEIEGCETAFAFDKEADCFSDDEDLNSNRWGWSIGPLSAPFDGAYDIYQAAGQCDLESGELVGTLFVSYVDGTVFVDFVANEGYAFFSTHLYVGSEKYPRKRNGSFTVAPGQYPYSHGIPGGAIDDSYKVDDVEGDIYIIAHAVVCPFKKEDDKKD